MSSIKRMNSTNICVLLFAVLITFVGASQRTAKAPIVRIHPVTRAEYDALALLSKDPTQIAEGRLITNGFAAIKGLALGLTSGIFPNFFTNLVNRNNDPAARDKIPNEISDKDDTEEDPPLCVIATEESTIDDPSERAENDDDDTPIVNCVVVVKNREGEDRKQDFHRNLLQQPNSGLPWYPPNSYANSMYMPWYHGAAAAGVQQSPYFDPTAYYVPYPYAYPQTLPQVAEFTPPKKKRNSKSKAKRRHRLARTLNLMSPSNLSHKFATEGGQQQSHEEVQDEEEEENEEKQQHQQQQQQQENDEFNEVMNEPEASVHTNELSNVAYEPVLYPQFGYQSNYPKVAYAHALPYPAPVYIAPSTPTPAPTTTTSTTPKPKLGS